MTDVVVRPIERSEAMQYLRVLPYAVGLSSWEPAPAAWHAGPGAWPDPGPPASEDTLRRWADGIFAGGLRTQAAFVDGKLVGGSGLVPLEITVPGERQVAMGKVAATGVLATHRRRGLLRAMMREMFADARRHGEPVLTLTASEGGIYRRFGFSPATQQVRWEMDRGDGALLPGPDPAGSLELTDAATAREVWPAIHDAARRTRVGEVSVPPDFWDGLSDEPAEPAGPLRYVVHRDDDGNADGVANYRIPWGPGPDDVGTVAVEALESTSPAAYRALWALLLDLDLTKRVVAASRPVDEPLRWMLQNPRAMRITRMHDQRWVRLLDVPAALQARTYGADNQLVLEVQQDEACPHNTGIWKLEAGPGGASCTPTDETPEVTLDIATLSALYLGGTSPAVLATAGRLVEHRDGALTLTARMFATDPPPHNAIGH